ncbi:hypothetical protein BDM02DRAFT_3268970 [Thelephora ganbajun]|uniref:Uncharacterized protein n=1 Tax=Thelephora ganbajun TaxID=370292 RepID=A0ACB6ZHV6_THEGA|nr:hypothetical protein BDM02DRAFT_3268970 [Thelephora ganbajun]
MSENSKAGSHPEIGLTAPLPVPREKEVKSSTASQDRHALAHKLFGGPREEKEKREDAARSEEVRRLRREAGDLKGLADRQRTEIARLRGVEEKLMGKCKRRDDRIMKLEREIERIRDLYQKTVEEQAQRIGAMELRLKQTEELLATRSAELSEARTFLSTTDRLSEMEVLSIVRDLNENIFQIAVTLTDEWEKLELSQASGRMDIDPVSRPRAPTLVQLARKRDLTGLTFLLQSCLCSQATKMTSSWGHHREFGVLKSVYKNLSTSEGQAISATWRSLTYRYLSWPPPHPASLMKQLAGVLDETGSFSSLEKSYEFVQAVALERIESMVQVIIRLKSTFMVEVTSSDMALLFEAPDTVFDDARMVNDFGSDSASASITERRDSVAGTMEVGVGKIICGGPGETRRREVLLKTKVVLEKDVVGDEA